MAKVYEANKKEFTCLDHFKAIAVNRLNKEYGPVFDRIDFVVEKELFKAVGYLESEVAPLEQKAGEILSEVQTAAVDLAENLADDSDKFCLFLQQLAPVKDKAHGNGNGNGQS